LKRVAIAFVLLLGFGCSQDRTSPSTGASVPAGQNVLGLPSGYQECLSGGAQSPDKEKVVAQCRPHLDWFAATLRMSSASKQALVTQIEGQGRRFVLGDNSPPLVPDQNARPHILAWAACASQAIIETDDGVSDPKTIAGPVVQRCHGFFDGSAANELDFTIGAISKWRADGRRLPPPPPPPPPPGPQSGARAPL
jgi:hypothetical protein